MIQHVAGYVWTGSAWSLNKKKALVYSGLGSLPSRIEGHGREAKHPLHLSHVRGGTTYGTYHPYHGDVKKGKNRKTRRSPHAYVRPADHLATN